MGIIPTEKSSQVKDFRSYTTLMHGDPKIGKSTFWSKMDGVLFLDTEGGLQALEVLRIPINSWDDFKNFMNELEATKPTHIKIIAVDTIDQLWDQASKKVCEIQKISHLSDLGWAKGYNMTKQSISLAIAKMKVLGYGVALISHTETKQEKVNGVPHDLKQCSLPNSARKEILPLVDFILYVGTKEVQQRDDDGNILPSKWERIIYTKPNRQIEAGDRLGALPTELPLDPDVFLKAFNDYWLTVDGKKKEAELNKGSS